MSRLSPLPLRVLLLGVLVVVAPACGKRGPPLPPLRPAPDKVTDITVLRRDGDVTIRFTTPTHNVDRSEPVLFDRVEIYALTVPAGGQSPNPTKVVLPKNRIGVLGQRPPAPMIKPVVSGEVPPPPPAVPLVFVETVATVIPALGLPPATSPARPSTTPVPGTLPATMPPGASPTAVAPSAAAGTQTTPVVPIASLQVATRFYVLVPYANRQRIGAMSDLLAVPLGPVPPPPTTATIKYDEQTLTFSWVAGVVGQAFHVYDATPGIADTAKPLTPAPQTALEFKRPVVFGTRVCLAVRGVRAVVAPVSLESAPSNVVCETPVDTFPPPAPTGLIAFAAEGSITLTWDSVTAADLAGYLVLRGEGTGDRLQPLMAAVLTGTSFVDTTTRPGVKYIYAVVAVDQATPANRSKESNRVEETGR